MHKAVLLYQDSLVTEALERVQDTSEIALSPEALLALRVLQKRYKICIFSGYPGTGREAPPALEVDQIQERVLNLLSQYGIHVELAPSFAFACQSAKSDVRGELHLRSLTEFVGRYAVDVRSSFVISDCLCDLETADKAGMRGVLIARSKNQDRSQVSPKFPVASGVWDAALSIIERDLYQQFQDMPLDIERAAMLLRNGRVVAFPTETVYGLGANALDPVAVARVFEIKRRPRFDPLIVHVAELCQLNILVTELPESARKLIHFFWPGPLTIVLPKSEHVPNIVTAGLHTVAIRMPDHPVALTLIRKAGVPIAAPSANLFGHVSPTTAEHVRQQLGEAVDFVLDGGRCPVGVESTVISILGNTAALLRPGGMPLEEIERVIGPVQRCAEIQRPMSPGQLLHHYAPWTPLILREHGVPEPGLRCGLLSFTTPTSTEGFVAVEVLSTTGDLREAAANLFAALHRLDAMHLDLIVAELVPDVGLGLAINDRLRRAARKQGSGLPTNTVTP
jgi:L-threonylcarbamoyladenylate synthase